MYDELKRAEQFVHGTSVVSSGLTIKGEISGTEDLLVEGRIEGPINLTGHNLTVGTGGKIKANVTAREVVVHGEVTGNLAASDRVEIKKEGSMTGDLKTGRIVIEEGAKFKGSIEILQREKAASA